MNYFTKILFLSSLFIAFSAPLHAQLEQQKRGRVEIERKVLTIDGPGEWVNLNLEVGDIGLKEATFRLYHPANTLFIDSVVSAVPGMTDSLRVDEQIKQFWDAAYLKNKDWVETRIHWKANTDIPVFNAQAFLRLKTRVPKGVLWDLAALIMTNTLGNNQFIGKDGLTYYPSSMGAYFPLLRKETLIFTFQDTVVTPGTSFCQDFTLLQNEAHLVALQMDFVWNHRKIRLDSIVQREMPKGDAATFQGNFSPIPRAQTSGFLRIAWTTGFENLKEMIAPKAQQVLFALCFKALDSLGNSGFRVDENQTIENLTKEFQQLNTIFLPKQVQVSVKPELWPGDANIDGVVNHFDFLPIGLAYNTLGPTRRNTDNMTWGKKVALDWETSLPGSQVDLKNVDADGNGVIDNLDINLISQFWNNRTQPGLQSTPEIRAIGTPLSINAQDIFASKPTALSINLGTEQEKMETAYGLAFAIEYDPGKINAEQIAFIPSKSWLGDPNADLIYFQYNDTKAGKLYIALSRVDGQARNGFGPIGDLMLQANATAGDKTTTEIQISETLAIDPQQNPQGLSTERTELNISTTVKTQEPVWAQYLRVTPSLSKGEVWIQANQNLQVQALECIDAQGRVLFSKTGTAATSLNLSNYSNGVYVLRIQTNEGTLNRRIMLQK
ncbi:T9SS type A sorting domain-containing protein [Haliscomenobacter sp.]|uniref:T9SS type A sorting domain-containing protein n=1 Tax=Haliscomenobacter sp. TaxID=2717303 RepID=UPI003BA8629E